MRNKKYLLNISVVIVSLVFSVFLAEILLRAYKNHQYKLGVNNWRNRIWLLMPESPRVFRIAPNVKVYVKKTNWTLITNQDGFRGRPLNDKYPGAKRILVIGDSYVFGWGVNTNQIFTSILEEKLNLKYQRKKYLVFNAGVPGYNTEQEYYLLESIISTAQPDVVILGYVVNDAEMQANVPPPPREVYKFIKLWLIEDIKEILNKRVFKKRIMHSNKRRHIFDYNLGFNEESPKWKESKDALFKIFKLCETYKAHLIVVTIPDFTQNFDERYAFKIIHEQVKNWSDEINIEHLDMLEYFEGKDHELYWIPAEQGHPNAKAHYEIANILSKELKL